MLTLEANAIEFAKQFSEKNAEAIGDLLADDFRLYDPKLKWVEGKWNVVQILQEQFAETELVEYEIAHLIQMDNTTLLEFRIRMDDLELFGVDIMDWEGGKMKELRCYYNPIGSLGPYVQEEENVSHV